MKKLLSASFSSVYQKSGGLFGEDPLGSTLSWYGTFSAIPQLG